MISTKKRMEIANICYANVAGSFAMFTNPKYRGEKFTWERFPEMMEREADLWMMLHLVKGKKDEVNALAKKFAREIAETLVERMSV